MNDLLRSLLWSALGLVLIVLPPYTFEIITQYFFLTHDPALFFSLSGARYYFDVASLAVTAGVLGLRLRNLTLVWSTYLISIFVLISLLFVVCDSRLCYSPGIDGFESLRMGSFFAAIGIATGYIGALRRGGPPSNKQRLVVGASAFYAIAYNGVIFTIAGASILTPFHPFAILAFLGILSIVISLNLGRETGTSMRVASVLAPHCVLLLVGIGIARQYSWETLPFVGLSLLAVVLGSSFGTILGRSRFHFVDSVARSPFPLAGMVFFVLLTTVVIWPDEVVGQVVTVSNSGEPDSYAFATPQYVGGFMSSPMVRPTAVAVNVSFAQSDLSTIVAGSFLAGGLGVHSADCCTDGIDYGFRFDLFLNGNGSKSLVGSAWKACDANAACGGHSWKVLMYHVSTPFVGSNTERPVRLTLRWENQTVVWQAVSGSNSRVIGSFEALPHMNRAFNAGWLGPPDNPSPGGAFFFQFGVTSLHPLRGNWAVTLSCPSILWNGVWACVDHSQSIQGDQSFWKVLWRWGEAFPNVDVTADAAGRSVNFNNSNSTIRSFVELW